MHPINHQIKINLKDFFLFGRFDCLELGMTKSEVDRTFPTPDDYSTDSRIWLYGNLELHFENDVLSMIFMDYIGTLTGGPKIELDPWVFNQQPSLSVNEMLTILLDEKASFRTHFNSLDQIEVIVEESLVTATFTEDTSELGAICLRDQTD